MLDKTIHIRQTEKTLEEMKEEMDGGMKCYLNCSGSLPLKNNPLRFAVCRQNGLSSNSWRVWVERAGDVYIVCRDRFSGLKISLHQSGKCHAAIDNQPLSGGDRYMGKWEYPLVDETKGVLPFKLLFPNTSLYLNQESRDSLPRIWDKNQVYIEAPESPFGTVLYFIIADASIVRADLKESLSYPLAVMPAWPGTRLWVIVSHVYEGGMLRSLWECMGKALEQMNDETAEKMELKEEAQVFLIALRGWTDDGGPYLMPFPIEIGKTPT